MPSLPMLLLLIGAAALAGFVDAAVGGGGLITIPALMLGLRGQPITTILGTNKVVACTGTSFAASQLVRSGVLKWQEMLGPMLSAMAGASAGVAVAYFLQGRFDRYLPPTMVLLMTLMLAFTLVKPQLGTLHAPRFGLRHQRLLAMGIALAIGFYDGFFGPGTGSLLIFLFVAILGFDFLRASALAKSVNWASNFASLVLFVIKGSWLPLVAVSMAVGNGLGGFFGARTALAKGSGWVRVVFMFVVGTLVLKLGWQMTTNWK